MGGSGARTVGRTTVWRDEAVAGMAWERRATEVACCARVARTRAAWSTL